MQAEDWQSDKCEVNVLEVVPDNFIVKRLDSAVRFVSESPYSSCFHLSQGRYRLDWRTSSRKLEVRIGFSTSAPSGTCSLYFNVPISEAIPQSILQLLGVDIIKHRNEFMQTILRAHDHLRAIKSNPLPTPAPFSAATLAFDPYVGRTLQMATPIRVVTPPLFEDACMAVERFLDGLFETSMLTSSDHLTTWQVTAYLTSVCDSQNDYIFRR